LFCESIQQWGHYANFTSRRRYRSSNAADGEVGLQMATSNAYDAHIIDRMLPKRDGLSIIEELRRMGNMSPVLILSALDDVDERVTGLKAGGDDYLTKPYSYTSSSGGRTGHHIARW